MEPSSTMRFIFASGSGTGMAEKRAFVYGCSGLRKISSVSPYSTRLPRYITPTESEMCSTTDRSCEMNRYVRWYFSCRSMSRLMICA